MGSKKQAAPPRTEGAVNIGDLPGYGDIGNKIRAKEAKDAADTQAAAAAKVAADEAAQVKAARDKAIQGGESAADIAARQTSTLANPVKQKVKGRRSLVSGAIGSGVSAGREQLG